MNKCGCVLSFSMDALPFSSKVAEPTTGRFRAERGRGRRGQAAAAARPWPCPALAQPHCETAFLQLCLHHAPAPIHKGEGRNGLDLCLVFVTSSSVSPSEQLDSIAAFLMGFMEGVSPKGQGADGLSWRYYSWYACFRRERSPTSRALPTAATSTRLREVPLQSRHVKRWDFPWMVHASRTSRPRPQTVAGDEHSQPLPSSLFPGHCAVGPLRAPAAATPASKPLRPRLRAPRGRSGALATSS